MLIYSFVFHVSDNPHNNRIINFALALVTKLWYCSLIGIEKYRFLNSIMKNWFVIIINVTQNEHVHIVTERQREKKTYACYIILTKQSPAFLRVFIFLIDLNNHYNHLDIHITMNITHCLIDCYR